MKWKYGSLIFFTKSRVCVSGLWSCLKLYRHCAAFAANQNAFNQVLNLSAISFCLRIRKMLKSNLILRSRLIGQCCTILHLCFLLTQYIPRKLVDMTNIPSLSNMSDYIGFFLSLNTYLESRLIGIQRRSNKISKYSCVRTKDSECSHFFHI